MFGIVVNFKMAPQRDTRVTVFALLRVGHKVSAVANFVGVSRITVKAIKKHMNDGKCVKDVQAVVE